MKEMIDKFKGIDWNIELQEINDSDHDKLNVLNVTKIEKQYLYSFSVSLIYVCM